MTDLARRGQSVSPPNRPAWHCPRCGYESFAGYFASGAVCLKCPDRPEMERAWEPKN